MSRLPLLLGYVQIKNTFFNTVCRTLQKAHLSSKSNSGSSSSSSSSSSSDDETNKQRKFMEKKKSKEALDKLNNLLLTMTGDDLASKSKLDLAKPTNKKMKKDEKPKKPKRESPEAEMVNAAKNVAESIGGDVKQTQSELLMKLLNVSSSVGSTETNLTDIVKGMKIDQEIPGRDKPSKAQQVRQILRKTDDTKTDFSKSRARVARQPRPDVVPEKIDLFGSDPLGIFVEKLDDYTEGIENKTWNHLHKRELKLAITHPPSNYFQQMILWTEQGKVWKFPIDNEQGLEEEKKVYFTEHVFLEKHLEPWCPPKGPLRHFMELVCVGLSKNPYLTVEAKKEHINWFKNYFEVKKQLLKETGLVQDIDTTEKTNQKQIE